MSATDPGADFAEALLAAEPQALAQLVGQAAPAALASAIAELGRRRQPAAAAALVAVDAVAADRSIRKAARRELHRLRSAGIAAPALDLPQPPASTAAASLAAVEVWATDVDGSGSRALWLVGERPLGGVWHATAILHDLRGLVHLDVADTTRKRVAAERERYQTEGGGTWVTLPSDYALQLMREGADLARAAGDTLPTAYRRFRELFGEAASGPERALVYARISPMEARFNPEWLSESGRLLREPELGGWHLSPSAPLRERALELVRTATSGLLVPGGTPEEQAARLLADAVAELLTPEMRRALRRRLEETAYLFLETDRLAAARLAVAAAQGLDDPALPAQHQPVPASMVVTGFVVAVRGETVRGRQASTVLVDLLADAMEQEAEGPARPTTPGGLILPR